MRLDKYLKLSRIIKRRTVAKDAGEQGRVEVNGKVAKPGLELRTGDIIEGPIRDPRDKDRFFAGLFFFVFKIIHQSIRINPLKKYPSIYLIRRFT